MKIVWLSCLLFLSMGVMAVPQWAIVPDKSTLSFSATQNNAPAEAYFDQFSGVISFSPEQLATSHVRIVVDMASVSADYEDLVVTLKMPEWFDVKKFPQAIFESSTFSKIKDDEYKAVGKLTIRDKTEPVTLMFKVKKIAANEMGIKGQATVERLQFGVGQGEWASTDEVEDEVKINVDITISKK